MHSKHLEAVIDLVRLRTRIWISCDFEEIRLSGLLPIQEAGYGALSDGVWSVYG